MPVKVVYKIRDEGGWHKESNQRFGAVAVAKFLSSHDDKRLFEWAPTIDDVHKMKRFCDAVLALDEKNKQIFQLGKSLEAMSDETPKTCTY